MTIPAPKKQHIVVTEAQYAAQEKLFKQFAEVVWQDTDYGYLWYSGDGDQQKSTYWFDTSKDWRLFPKPGRNTYFGVHGSHELRQGRRALESSIKAVRVFYGDFDAKLFPGDTLEEQLENARNHIESLVIPFNLVVFTGGGYHVYTILDKPFVIETELDLERVKLFQKAFVHHIGADPAACDIARVLRYFPSWNMKDAYEIAPFVHAVGTPDFTTLYLLADVLSVIKPTLDKLMGEADEQRVMTARKREKALEGIKAEHPRIRAYVSTALESAIEDVAATPKGGGAHGGRAMATYKKCISLMVRFGDFLTDQQVIDAMRDACTRNGYIHDDGESDFIAQVTNGIKHGRAKGADLSWLEDVKQSIEYDSVRYYDAPVSDEDAPNFDYYFAPDDLPMSQDFVPDVTAKNPHTVARKKKERRPITSSNKDAYIDEFLAELDGKFSDNVLPVRFPFAPLNKFGGDFGWMEPGRMIGITSGVSQGKTAFGTQVADMLEQNLLWFGPEVKRKRLTGRRLQRADIVSIERLKSHEVWMRYKNAGLKPPEGAERLDDATILRIKTAQIKERNNGWIRDSVDEKCGYEEFGQILEYWYRRVDDYANGRIEVNGDYQPHKIHGVYIDYFQLMNLGAQRDNWYALEDVAQDLLEFAEATGTYVLAVSQIKRGSLRTAKNGTGIDSDSMQGLSSQKFSSVITLNTVFDQLDNKWPVSTIIVDKNSDGKTGRVMIPNISSRFMWLPQELSSYDREDLENAMQRVKEKPESYYDESRRLETRWLAEYIREGGKVFWE